MEAHHSDYVYGNTFVNATAGYPIHYFSDMGSPDDNRLGTLWFYNNSFFEPLGKYYSWRMFDTSGGGGGDSRAIEWPQIQVLNNVIWMESAKKPFFYWNKDTNQFTTFGRNVLNANWGTGNMLGGDGTGWSTKISEYSFQGASNRTDTAGISNLVGVSVAPFNLATFAPNKALVKSGTGLPAFWPRLPIRFQYGPSAIQTIRKQPLTEGAME